MKKKMSKAPRKKAQKRKQTIRKNIPFSEILKSCPSMSPLQYIYQVYPKAQIEVLNKGGPNKPMFMAIVKIDGRQFSVMSGSKQMAKQKAAMNVISYLSGERVYEPASKRQATEDSAGQSNAGDSAGQSNAEDSAGEPPAGDSVRQPPVGDPAAQPLAGDPAGQPPAGDPAGQPIESNTSETVPNDPEGVCTDVTIPNEVEMIPVDVEDKPMNEAMPQIPYVGWNENLLNLKGTSKTPVSCLQERCNQAIDYTYMQNAEHQLTDFHFKAVASFNGCCYEGYGINKRTAKQNAAWRALDSLDSIANETSAIFGSQNKIIATKGGDFNGGKADDFSDKVYAAIEQKFQEVCQSNPGKSNWKVLSGIVASNPKGTDLTVLCLTTGAKTIAGPNMTLDGTTVFDSHAEIVARRCFKLFCYDQLDKLTKEEPTEGVVIFERDDDTGRFCLKKDVEIHLYISTSPCGDARLFAMNEKACSKEDPYANRPSRGVLRTKIECGEGTVLIPEESIIQTWDGILNGDQRLKTHSCSDKVLRWNVLGLQGALLSQFFDPIYLNRIILGALLHQTHMDRAVTGRLTNIDLPNPYRLNETINTRISSPLQRNISKSPSYAHNWIIGDTVPEITDATKGLVENGSMSRLCKRKFFEYFVAIQKRRCPEADFSGQTYEKVKETSTEYQQAKKSLFEGMEKQKLGTWIAKPRECDQFTL